MECSYKSRCPVNQNIRLLHRLSKIVGSLFFDLQFATRVNSQARHFRNLPVSVSETSLSFSFLMQQLSLQAEDGFVLKVVQLEELLAVRHSVFVIGGAGTGKTQVSLGLLNPLNLPPPPHPLLC